MLLHGISQINFLFVKLLMAQKPFFVQNHAILCVPAIQEW